MAKLCVAKTLSAVSPPLGNPREQGQQPGHVVREGREGAAVMVGAEVSSRAQAGDRVPMGPMSHSQPRGMRRLRAPPSSPLISGRTSAAVFQISSAALTAAGGFGEDAA